MQNMQDLQIALQGRARFLQKSCSVHGKCPFSCTYLANSCRNLAIHFCKILQAIFRHARNLALLISCKKTCKILIQEIMTIVKPNGKLLICIDPHDLNQAIKRVFYPMRTIEEIAARMPNAKLFSKLDTSSGYWQVKLDRESSKLCTFNTPMQWRIQRGSRVSMEPPFQQKLTTS